MTSAEAQRQILKHLVDLNRPEAMINALDALQQILDYEKTFEIVNEMQNNNLIKIVYCVAPSIIHVQLTRVGRHGYQNNSTA